MTTHAPDQSDRARTQITKALARGDDHIDHATARLIAATVHAGTGTALEAFASTGRFDIDLLDRELRQQRYPFAQELWRGALLAYLDWQRSKRLRLRSLTPSERRRLAARRLGDAGEQLPLFADGEQPPSIPQRSNN